MKKRLYSLIALCLVVAMLLSGCGVVDFAGYFRELGDFFASAGTVNFEDMEYTRPDMEDFRQRLQDVNDTLAAEEDVDTLMDAVYTLYEGYYSFYTAYALANIHYSMDLTDTYWEEEYNFCLSNGSEVDAGMDQLLYDLAASPLKEELEADSFFGDGFFDEYSGESIWDETFTDMMNQEAQLQSRYYQLSSESMAAEYYSEEFFTTYGLQMAQLYVELVSLRQEMAAYAGYPDYLSFAYDFYHYRDYTPQQAQSYLDAVEQELVPMYRELDQSALWEISGVYCSEEDTFEYVRAVAENMGGTMADAFALMESAGLYDISFSETKYDASFEIFLMDYLQPFIFVNPTGSAYDKLTFVHEFGHFCNDYASYGSMAGVDVAEVFSQGMEYLSLCYGEDTGDLAVLKMADSLCTFVEQSAYASFEQQVYSLTGDDLTVENVYALYEGVGKAFGFDTWGWDSRDFVIVTHFFTNPMYIISYVVSNDAALQLYQMEKAESGAGLALFEDNLNTQEAYFLAFVESAGLTDPFTDGRVAQIRQTLEEVLK